MGNENKWEIDSHSVIRINARLVKGNARERKNI